MGTSSSTTRIASLGAAGAAVSSGYMRERVGAAAGIGKYKPLWRRRFRAAFLFASSRRTGFNLRHQADGRISTHIGCKSCSTQFSRPHADPHRRQIRRAAQPAARGAERKKHKHHKYPSRTRKTQTAPHRKTHPLRAGNRSKTKGRATPRRSPSPRAVHRAIHRLLDTTNHIQARAAELENALEALRERKSTR